MNVSAAILCHALKQTKKHYCHTCNYVGIPTYLPPSGKGFRGALESDDRGRSLALLLLLFGCLGFTGITKSFHFLLEAGEGTS